MNQERLLKPEIDLLKQRLFPRYRILSLLAITPFSKVVLVEDTKLRRKCVLKIIRIEHLERPGSDREKEKLLQRFFKEARLYARFKHPGIVTIYDIADDAFPPYIIVEHVEGKSLEEMLEEKEKLPPEEAARICMQVLESLQLIHSSGAVHRDIKPANIILEKESGRAVIIDFGAASVLQERQTSEGEILGTFRYLAPELRYGRQDPGPESDLYSVGVVLLEMLTGRAPAPEIFEEELEELEASGRIPACYMEVIRKATARDRKKRFCSAAEFREALSRCLQPERKEEEVQQQAVSAAPETKRFPAWPFAAAGAVLLIALLLKFSANPLLHLSVKSSSPALAKFALLLGAEKDAALIESLIDRCQEELALLLVRRWKAESPELLYRLMLSEQRSACSMPYLKEYLLEKGAAERCLECLRWAIKQGDKDWLRQLLDAGADLSMRDSEGRGPLHWAVERSLFAEDAAQILKLLLERGADVNSADSRGWTPLHFAVLYASRRNGYNLKLIYLLLSKGAEPSAKTRAEWQGFPPGTTPFDIAAYRGVMGLVKYLTGS